jgi:hypothetical protein
MKSSPLTIALSLAAGAAGAIAAQHLPSLLPVAVAETAPVTAHDEPAEVAQAAQPAEWESGSVWRLYQEDWEYSLPPEYAGKVAGVDYNFTASDKPLRHSDVLIDGLADGLRDGWTSMADQVVAGSVKDFGFNEHPDPALHSVQPWKIDGERAAKILNHGAARGAVLADGTILRTTKGEMGPNRDRLLALFAESACLDWTGVLFEPGSRIEFEKDGGIGFAVLDDACYPNL